MTIFTADEGDVFAPAMESIETFVDGKRRVIKSTKTADFTIDSDCQTHKSPCPDDDDDDRYFDDV